jgi:undecaprenyl-diphosphatase
VIDLLQSVDVAALRFINVTLSNPVGDWLWPAITNYDRFLPARIVLLGLWVWMLVRGGVRGKTVALLLIPVIVASDQLNSSLLKELIGRPRPCHEFGGLPVVQGLHMLVDCGPGKSFPSSHAVNNFAVATLIARWYPRLRWWLFGWAALVALSRPAVGVHYPSDILAGAGVGMAVAFACIGLWTAGSKWYARRSAANPSPEEGG